jgi:hypothetical protein
MLTMAIINVKITSVNSTSLVFSLLNLEHITKIQKLLQVTTVIQNLLKLLETHAKIASV